MKITKEENMSKIKVLIVDDQPIVREGIKGLLSISSEIEIVNDANNGQQAFDMISKEKPDVVLMDIRMPIMDGVQATKKIKETFDDVVVIILTTFEDDEYIIDALSYGASGYLLKDISAEHLIQAIIDGYHGNIMLPTKVAQKLTSRLSKPKPEIDLEMFTNKEKEVIKLLVKGYSNQDIAGELYLSLGTVKNYVSQIYAKAEVSDRSHAIVYFKNLGY